MAKLHLPGTADEQDMLVLGRLARAGTITYPKRFPGALLEELGFNEKLANDVFCSLKRLEKLGLVRRTVSVTSPGLTTHGFSMPASRTVTVELVSNITRTEGEALTEASDSSQFVARMPHVRSSFAG